VEEARIGLHWCAHTDTALAGAPPVAPNSWRLSLLCDSALDFAEAGTRTHVGILKTFSP